ncbi:peptidoglycan-binding protein [Caulobacter sp. NIBR1757]|uniref:peptidoglycan-binding protein n=1 Tax=Caulobacter sp. NIBR1757 TaxID=3016000 RepID=UPI0022F04BFF|nr:peptidoglycan-binding protein [Caulobacter sp. NIBR1757]
MTLGEWLNHMIVEGEAPDTDIETADPSVIPHPRPDAPARLEAVHHPADEVGKVTDAIERLTSRIEAAEQRSTLAITGIDQSVRGALSRLEGAEREHISVAARFEGAVDEIRTEQSRAIERLRRIEAESTGPRSAEALRALEGSVGKVASAVYDTEARSREAIAALEAKVAALEAGGAAPDSAALAEEVAARVLGRLEAAETQTKEAIRDLGYSFVKLDGRLRKVEGADNTAALQTLSHGLNARLEQVRQEMAEQLRRSSDGGFGRVEQKLGEMTAHVHAAEQRSAMAIERMGREMVSMADNLSRRVQSVEGRSAQAVENVGSEVSRIAGLVEQRLAHNDGSQAQALERLGVEIARITERLSERIANSERRSAQAIDDVGEQVARVTERISQRQERVSTDLAERIRQSEERTARLLDEAREKIDASMTSATRRIADSVTAAVPAPAPAPTVRRPGPAGMDPFAPDPFPTRGQAIPDDAFAPRGFESPSFAAATLGPAEPGFDDDFPSRDTGPAAFSDADFDAADEFVALDDDNGEPEFEAAPAPVFDAEPSRPLSTREVIEQARAAARNAGGAASAPAAAKPARKGLFGSRPKPAKKQASSALTTALAITAVLACGGIATTGYVLQSGGKAGDVGDRIAQSLKIKEADSREILTAEADTTPGLTTAPRVALALAPDVVDPEAATVPQPTAVPAPPAANPPLTAAGLFGDAVRKIEARQAGGLDALRKSANQGYAPAQFYLAKLYENGEGGLAKDAAQARNWTERAAQGGERKAMHNLGLYYFEGTGGPTNQKRAAEWFRRAADLGLTDSQYNLGKLYEIGSGVPPNSAEAYKWYLIAGRAGDAEARASAQRLRDSLPPAARTGAERAASGYRVAAPTPAARLMAAAHAVGTSAQAQRALSRLGYYQGPQDGKASPALEGALKAYQKDKGLPVTGQMDAQSSSSLAIYAQ